MIKANKKELKKNLEDLLEQKKMRLLTEKKIVEVSGYVFDKSEQKKQPCGEGLYMFEYECDGKTETIDTPEVMTLRAAEEYVAKEAKGKELPEGTKFKLRYK